MINRKQTTQAVIQIGLALALAAAAAFMALILAGSVGGVAMGVAPEFTFGLVEPLICREGQLQYYSVQRSFHESGESEPHLECIRGDQSEPVLLSGILSVLALSFAAFCGLGFLILFIPLSALTAWLVRRYQ